MVSPVLTRSATRFVGPLTFSALAAEPARTSLFGRLRARVPAGADGGRRESSVIPHVELGRHADAVVVVPATARLIGSYAAGISSDLLTSVLLATHAPVLLCPAMHTEMWEHPGRPGQPGATAPARCPCPGAGRRAPRRRRLRQGPPSRTRRGRGCPGGGLLPWGGGRRRPSPCGPGRAACAGSRLSSAQAGHENPSTRCVTSATAARASRATPSRPSFRAAALQVVLVTSSPLSPPAGVEVIEVETAAEMAESVLGRAAGADVVVMAAAVADYRPSDAASAKIKKSDMPMAVRTGPDPGHPGRAGCP